MKQTLQRLQPHLSKIITALVIIAAIVVIIVIAVTRPKKDTSSETVTPTPQEETTATSPTAPQSGFVVTTEPFIIPFSAKATATTDDQGDKHGTFSVVFTVDPSNKDLVIKPVCHSEEGGIKTDGVAFSLIKDGTHVTGTNLSSSSCIVLNHGAATKTSNGDYLVKAGTQNSFELVVVYNPADAGGYRLQVTNIGYRRSAKSISQFFDLSPQTLQSLKTNNLAL